MIGIGTIGRAAESGGSTTNQNGQYIAFTLRYTNTTTRLLYYSTDFGATFNTRTLPIPTENSQDTYINYLGEIMLVYTTSLYYAASPTSDWVLIENQHTSGRCDVSWDFNTIVYASGTSGYTYYLSTNKGVSFTPKSITGSPFYINDIVKIIISGDGSKVSIRSTYNGNFLNTVINSITGTYITDSFSPGGFVCKTSNYYGDYFTGYDVNSADKSCIKHLTTYTLKYLNGTYARLATPSDNGWATECVTTDSTIRFYNLPSYSQYKSITPPTVMNIYTNRPISGDYVYFLSIPSGATYANIYRVDNIAGHSYELIKQIDFGTVYFQIREEAVSKVPPTLL